MPVLSGERQKGHVVKCRTYLPGIVLWIALAVARQLSS